MKQFKITILLAVLMSMFGVKAYAHDIEVANKDGVTIYYNWINDKTELAVTYRGENYYSYSNEYEGDVYIPKSIEYDGKTYSVASIQNYAFYGCSDMSSIEILDNVIKIESYAFYGCSGLTSIEIPNSVTSIGQYAFYGCSGLTSIKIPNSVTSIGKYAFFECINMVSAVIGSGVKFIGEYAFSEDSWNYNSYLKKTIWLTNTPPSGASYAQGSINYVSNEEFNINNRWFTLC